MNHNVPESQAEPPTRKGNIESPLYNAEKLISLSAQAKILAWVVMIPSIIFIVAATINMLWIFVVRTDRVYAPDINDFMYYLTSLSPAFIGLVLSILLRIVAEGVLLLMDLEIDLRERIDRQV